MRHIYADFVDKVSKPARYLGGEYMSVSKPRGAVAARVVLAFPDVYEIGMSHLGTKILYSLLNKSRDIACERAFTPWVDMEAELRARALPLVSLESSTPLCDFDVVGISLQYELTFSNVLTLLDLGGVPLRSAERTGDHPIVVGGGPTASHPEPMAPFFDCFFIGEAEQELPRMLTMIGESRSNGVPRHDILRRMAREYPVYVPALYATDTDEATGMTVVGAPIAPGVPPRIRRGVVDNLDNYPFPDDSPVPYAEAVFDRASIEIARGCTEGCRFCQAGMIYRPVRERSPDSIVQSVLGGVAKAGYDETSLTSLSTADFSCVTPLVTKVAAELKRRKVSLSVSSLRAYGLTENILDEMAQMRITGLTFAPEAGTQRMRDVVNKNVTEAHIEESANRVFSRGWNRLKLYFMIGLPTEQDEDVVGIVQTGQRMLDVGRGHVGRRAEVTVSVSSHVPKPHTPFQWCRQDSVDEIRAKQRRLRSSVSMRGLKLKYHNCGISFVEGVLARGDRRVADGIELAWRRGARFDGWDELFDLERWQQAFIDAGIDADAYLDTRPVEARLPWDHIDVGLEDGFLLKEYRKALRDRLSPPCGKVVGQLIHHDNLEDATADSKRLVCYDCGIACDLTEMREDRLVALESLGAHTPPVRKPKPEGTGAHKPPFARRPKQHQPTGPRTVCRVRYTKLARAAFVGHLDTLRMLGRLFRRAEIKVAYTSGFHPKPTMEFAPALPLGVASLGELVDVTLEGVWTAQEVKTRLAQVAPEGIWLQSVVCVPPGGLRLSKLIRAYDLLILPGAATASVSADVLQQRVATFLAAKEVIVERKKRDYDVRPFVKHMDIVDAPQQFAQVVGWPRHEGLIFARVELTPNGSAKPIELARAIELVGDGIPSPQFVRLGFQRTDAPGDPDWTPAHATVGLRCLDSAM